MSHFGNMTLEKKRSPLEIIELIKERHYDEEQLLLELEKVCKDLPGNEFDVETLDAEFDEDI